MNSCVILYRTKAGRVRGVLDESGEFILREFSDSDEALEYAEKTLSGETNFQIVEISEL